MRCGCLTFNTCQPHTHPPTNTPSKVVAPRCAHISNTRTLTRSLSLRESNELMANKAQEGNSISTATTEAKADIKYTPPLQNNIWIEYLITRAQSRTCLAPCAFLSGVTHMWRQRPPLVTKSENSQVPPPTSCFSISTAAKPNGDPQPFVLRRSVFMRLLWFNCILN